MNKTILWIVAALLVFFLCFILLQRSKKPTQKEVMLNITHTMFNYITNAQYDKAEAMKEAEGGYHESSKGRQIIINDYRQLNTVGNVQFVVTEPPHMKNNNPHWWIVPYEMHLKYSVSIIDGSGINQLNGTIKSEVIIENIDTGPLKTWRICGGI